MHGEVVNFYNTEHKLRFAKLALEGFIIFDYAKKFPGAITQLSEWVQEKKLTYTETVVEGFDNIPQAFLDLFEGKNKGKMIVKV